MSISAPPGQPRIWPTVIGALRDSFSLIRGNPLVPVAFVAIGSLLAAGAYTIAARNQVPAGFSPELFALSALWVVIFLTLYYSAFAESIRSLRPDFRMTGRMLLGVIGNSFLAGILTFAAGLCFVIPAYWVGVKVSLMPFAYALRNGAPETLRVSWEMTNGYYWQTLGMYLLVGLPTAAAMFVLEFASIFVRTTWAEILLVPLILAVFVWATYFQPLAYARWTDALLPRADGMQFAAPAPVPA